MPSAGRDYYRILGVSHQASAEGIRDAYRRLAKQMHPDRIGPGGTKAFQELARAYEVLSDPGSRREYDRELTPDDSIPPRSPRPEVLKRRPDRRVPVGGLFGQVLDELTRPSRCRSLNLEVVLSSEEAMAGGVIPIPVPVVRSCPGCLATGHRGWLVCSVCRGRGQLEAERIAHVAIPPGVRSGTLLEVPLDRVGVRDLRLRLHLTVTR